MDFRFLWPMAACLFDLHSDPSSRDFGARVDSLIDSLAEVLEQTGNLLQTLLESWITESGLDFLPISGEGE